MAASTHGFTVDEYLKRLRFDNDAIARLVSMGPCLEQLKEIYTRHLRTVPFENLDQHEHSAGEIAPSISRKTDTPCLVVAKSLNKIVRQGRGGFCFEINPCFHWLLNQMGYQARFSLCDVGCQGGIPTHLLILVSWPSCPCEYLVDPGFGDPSRIPLALSSSHEIVTDECGDDFQFVAGQDVHLPESGAYPRLAASAERPTVVLMKKPSAPALMRRRDFVPDAPIPERQFKPMYRFAVEDDLEVDCEEFIKGLQHVLTSPDVFFTQKRFCAMATEGGHITLASNRLKFVHAGAVVREEPLETEDQWRAALRAHFQVELQP